MAYRRTIPVEFNACDPAGIVFYPRYFEMTNSVVETFFAEVAGQSFAEMMRAGEGVPTARLEADFVAPSRLGDRLEFLLSVTRIGRSSVGFAITARCGGELRITVALTLVRVAAGRPAPWPQPMRDRMTAHLEGDRA